MLKKYNFKNTYLNDRCRFDWRLFLWFLISATQYAIFLTFHQQNDCNFIQLIICIRHSSQTFAHIQNINPKTKIKYNLLQLMHVICSYRGICNSNAVIFPTDIIYLFIFSILNENPSVLKLIKLIE